ncbi:hypothetical protein TWF217_004990 [Orbilia oligospora]|nr:hypothetical protein TWF751_007206 [Orbilia oligospora]KAF3259961.1 hypothetical protein TWF217_004990 [Orbilia oligospora]
MTASALDLGKDNHRRVRDWFVQYAYDTRPTEMGTMTQILAAITDIDFVPDNHTISNQYNINYRAMYVTLRVSGPHVRTPAVNLQKPLTCVSERCVAGVIRETTVICSGLSIDNIIGSRTRAKRRAR